MHEIYQVPLVHLKCTYELLLQSIHISRDCKLPSKLHKVGIWYGSNSSILVFEKLGDIPCACLPELYKKIRSIYRDLGTGPC